MQITNVFAQDQQDSAAPIETKKVKFKLPGYQEASGVIKRAFNSGSGMIIEDCDPYLATMAVITAAQNGLDVKEAGTAWIDWILAKYEKDGKLSRYRRNLRFSDDWEFERELDAVDATNAVIIQLCYTLKREDEMPPLWKKALVPLKQELNDLFDRNLGFTKVSQDNGAMYFTDNAEVLDMLETLAEKLEVSSPARATQYDISAKRLRQAMAVHFKTAAGDFKSLQDEEPGDEFYPDVTTILDAIRYGFYSYEEGKAVYNRVMSENRSIWLDNMRTDFAQGRVLKPSFMFNDQATIDLWYKNAKSLRYSYHVTPEDEAVIQIVEARKGINPTPNFNLRFPELAQ